MPWSQEVDSNLSDVRRPARIGSGADTLCIIHVDLISLIESHGLSAHLYADDTQVYGSCRPADVVSFSMRLSGWCLDLLSPPNVGGR